MKVELHAVRLPDVKAGDDIGELICQNFDVADGDVVVVTSKIVSKAEGRVVRLEDVVPSDKAQEIAEKLGKPAEIVELIMQTSDVVGALPVLELVKQGAIDVRMLSCNEAKALKVLETDASLLITLLNGSLYTDAGIDASNVPPGYVALPPADPMESARRIRESIRSRSGKNVAVLISDTEVFIGGSIGVCRGYAGICPVTRKFGSEDMYGKPKWGGADALVHEICCAASLLMGQTSEGIAAVVIRGIEYEEECEFEPVDLEAVVRIIVRENAKLFGMRKIIGTLLRLLK